LVSRSLASMTFTKTRSGQVVLCQDTLRTGRSLPRLAQAGRSLPRHAQDRSFFARTRSGRVQGRLEFKKQWVRSVPPAQLASSAELPLAVEAHVGLQSCPILRHASCETRPSFLNFSYVCPEPVLVKGSFIYINGSKKRVCRTILARSSAIPPTPPKKAEKNKTTKHTHETKTIDHSSHACPERVLAKEKRCRALIYLDFQTYAWVTMPHR
jgi:hypothetical protein